MFNKLTRRGLTAVAAAFCVLVVAANPAAATASATVDDGDITIGHPTGDITVDFGNPGMNNPCTADPPTPSINATITDTTATVNSLSAVGYFSVGGDDYRVTMASPATSPVDNEDGVVDHVINNIWSIDDLVVGIEAEVDEINDAPDCTSFTSECDSIFAQLTLHGMYTGALDPSEDGTGLLDGDSSNPPDLPADGIFVADVGCQQPILGFHEEAVVVDDLEFNF